MTRIVEVSVVIDAPQKVVFDAFTDFETSARIFHQAARVEFKSTERAGSGAEWEQEREYGNGKSTIARHRITAFDSPRSYVMTTDDRSSFETMTFEFSEHGPQTLVAFRVEAKVKSFAARVVAALLGRMVRSFMQDDLNRMKAHIEGNLAPYTSQEGNASAPS